MTLYDIKWRDLFDKWLDQESDILELREAILNLYLSNYEISDKEWRTWRAFIQNAGCANITPFKKEESEVIEMQQDCIKKRNT